MTKIVKVLNNAVPLPTAIAKKWRGQNVELKTIGDSTLLITAQVSLPALRTRKQREREDKAWEAVRGMWAPRVEAAWKAVEGIWADDRKDPVVWQRKVRKDRPLP